MGVNDVGKSSGVTPTTNDDQTFTDNLNRHGFDAFRLARFLGSTPEDAADVVQEASILAWRYRHTRRGEWRPWFLSIVRRVAHRRRRTLLVVPKFWEPAPADNSFDSFGDSEVAAVMNQLPRRQRVAILLRYVQDLTFKDVGIVLGLRESAARQLVARAYANLREKLTEGAVQ
jgi:RNA polymerase sigma-70 factor (ECF subfamily)